MCDSLQRTGSAFLIYPCVAFLKSQVEAMSESQCLDWFVHASMTPHIPFLQSQSSWESLEHSY